MHNENLFIQLQLEIQRLQLENAILDTALLNACQTICRELDYKESEIQGLKQKYISRVKNDYKIG